MRGVAIRAGVALAMLGVATPAVAQVTFIKCVRARGDDVWAVQGSSVYRWDSSNGLRNACDEWLTGSTRCLAQAGENVITMHITTAYSDITYRIDRLTGGFSYRRLLNGDLREEDSGTCSKVSDPRTAPRAF